MAKLDPRTPAPLHTLTAPVHVITPTYLRSWLQTPDFPQLQDMLQQRLLGPSSEVVQVDVLPDHLHNVNIIHLSNGSYLVIKAGPSPIVPLLRHERSLLENEAHALQILARSHLPIPRILKHDPTSTRLDSPFLLSTFVPGAPFVEVQKLMSLPERATVERQLRLLIAAIGQHVPSVPDTYGPLALAASHQGYKTWREAFRWMLESVLMDAEDLLINLPYAQIRTEVAESDNVLDDVREARLVIPGLTEPRNILIDRSTNTITGLLDFGGALWGDWQIGVPDAAVGIKGQIYTIYHAIVTIVKHSYRRQNDNHDLDARKTLMVALRQLARNETQLNSDGGHAAGLRTSYDSCP
ncbi:MAG: hypothetical protein L6R42_000371 [Xanthoria sp. 1 TBL-2021]|nr:MAG: hypothetical protein L6R42_000371 [Xanthoria sp. 1 TBL-2021]